jgi:hypothetical protein
MSSHRAITVESSDLDDALAPVKAGFTALSRALAAARWAKPLWM